MSGLDIDWNKIAGATPVTPNTLKALREEYIDLFVDKYLDKRNCFEKLDGFNDNSPSQVFDWFISKTDSLLKKQREKHIKILKDSIEDCGARKRDKRCEACDTIYELIQSIKLEGK